MGWGKRRMLEHNFEWKLFLIQKINTHRHRHTLCLYPYNLVVLKFATVHLFSPYFSLSSLWCFRGLLNQCLLIFSLLQKAFLGFMNGKAPQTILTDQNMCLKEAIAIDMPSTKHALCIWMIVAKFPSWFNAVLGDRYNEWKAEFYRLYNLESIEDFELGWRDMVDFFGLHTNRHIANLFALRTLWALPYLRSHFFAGMTTTGHSKAINSFIQRFLSAQTRLAQFVEQVCYLYL